MMEPENDPVSSERLYQRVIRGRHLDGVILSTSVLGDPFIGRVASDGVPAVMIGRHPTLTTVDVDNVTASLHATRHLLGHGYRRIAHISGPGNIMAANERTQGYEMALSEAGVPLDPDLIERGDFTETSGYVAMRALLDTHRPKPDAVFAGSDTMAVGAIRAIIEAGLTVPGEIAVMGFDGLERHARALPSLSTVVQPIAELGKAAVNTLLHRIAHPEEPVFHHYLDTWLNLRGSCGCSSVPKVGLVDAGATLAPVAR